MTTDNVMEFFVDLGFEETDIEDGLTALSFELDEEGNYALITDENGGVPQTLRQVLVFACYSSEGAYLWSASFKNSYLFQETWSENPEVDQKLLSIQKYRETNMMF